MKTYPRLSFAILSFVGCLLVPVVASAMPAAGSNELRVDSTYIIPGYAYTGFNHLWSSQAGSSSASLFGFGMAYGRFVTDNVEVGTGVTLIYSGGSNAVVIPGISPFLRLFHPIGAGSGIFGAAVVGAHFMAPDRGNTITVLSGGVDAGFEFFPAESWSLRIGPSYRYIHESASGDSATLHSIGVNWAIAGYF